MFRLVYLCKPDELFCGRPVAQFRRMLGAALAGALPRRVAGEANCVIPVPATGICYAEGLARGLGKPLVHGLKSCTCRTTGRSASRMWSGGRA